MLCCVVCCVFRAATQHKPGLATQAWSMKDDFWGPTVIDTMLSAPGKRKHCGRSTAVMKSVFYVGTRRSVFRLGHRPLQLFQFSSERKVKRASADPRKDGRFCTFEKRFYTLNPPQSGLSSPPLTWPPALTGAGVQQKNNNMQFSKCPLEAGRVG